MRVIEEYFRFVDGPEQTAAVLKGLRHQIECIEQGIGPEFLLQGRDVASDPFANENRPEEMNRETLLQIITASFKRGQEATRVIEEYSKLTESPQLSGIAKHIRFSLYTIEKEWRKM